MSPSSCSGSMRRTTIPLLLRDIKRFFWSPWSKLAFRSVIYCVFYSLFYGLLALPATAIPDAAKTCVRLRSMFQPKIVNPIVIYIFFLFWIVRRGLSNVATFSAFLRSLLVPILCNIFTQDMDRLSIYALYAVWLSIECVCFRSTLRAQKSQSQTTSNLLLPTWESTLRRPVTQDETMKEGALMFDRDLCNSGKGSLGFDPEVLKDCKSVVVIGVQGWSSGPVMRALFGQPRFSSPALANMMAKSIEEFCDEHLVKIEKITKIPLHGDGTIQDRVNQSYANLQSNHEWMADLHEADAILFAAHSQGSIVSTHLLDLLVKNKHVRTSGNTAPGAKIQRICLLAMCGIHQGLFRYLSTDRFIVKPYFKYFETEGGRQLFEFKSTSSTASKKYTDALQTALDHGVKMLYVASITDPAVPLYSALFTAASHPSILRAIYIDTKVYKTSDFLTNLMVLIVHAMNAGISDRGLFAHLSDPVAGNIRDLGHMKPAEEPVVYSLAVKYLFSADRVQQAQQAKLILKPFDALKQQNDYEIPWYLCDFFADKQVAKDFSREITQLLDAFREWRPNPSIILGDRNLKLKLQPVAQLLSSPSS